MASKRGMRILKNSCFAMLLLALYLFSPLPALAVDETYAQAIAQAEANCGYTGSSTGEKTGTGSFLFLTTRQKMSPSLFFTLL